MAGFRYRLGRKVGTTETLVESTSEPPLNAAHNGHQLYMSLTSSISNARGTGGIWHRPKERVVRRSTTLRPLTAFSMSIQKKQGQEEY